MFMLRLQSIINVKAKEGTNLILCRGNTCKFNPALREQSLAQILRPTNMAMHYNQASYYNFLITLDSFDN